MIIGLLLALTALAGWSAWQFWSAKQSERLNSLFVQVARQGAVNLSTIDWQRADADVDRITESAAGAFLQAFSEGREPLLEVVKQSESTSEGTVTGSGLEVSTGDAARVLVAVNVTSTSAADPQDQSRAWRMRISVERVDDAVKITDVVFVP